MESLVEELTCPVCLELYEQPVLLPCAHSLCKKCAGDVLAEAARKPPQQAAGQGAAPKQVQCPSCRHEFQLPELGVEGLRRNTTLQNIVDRYREAKNTAAAPKAVPCQMCDLEPPAEAVKTCLVCDNSYCETCLGTFHPMKGGLARHTLTEPSAAAPKVLMCTEHVQEKVNMYCATDQSLVCPLCKLVGKHKDHEVGALSDTFQQKKDSIGGRVAGLIQQNAEVECFLDTIQKTMTQTEENCAGIKRSVDVFAGRLSFAIEKRKLELHAKVEKEKDQKLRTLGKQLDQWADTGTGITAAIAEAETLLNEEDPIAFLQASTMVEDRLDAFAHLNERKLKTTGQFTNNTGVVSDLEQKIWSLDFLQVPEAPVILTGQCTAGRNYITVSWAAGGNTPVDQYSFLYGKANQSDWQGSFVTTNTSIRLKSLEENTAYTVVVIAENSAGNAESTTVNIKTKRGGLQFVLCGAPPAMIITNGGKSVTCSRGARSGGYNQPGVKGNVVIDKGRHYWEVNVEGSSDFGLGVAAILNPKSERNSGHTVTYRHNRATPQFSNPAFGNILGHGFSQGWTNASFVDESMQHCMNASLSEVNQNGEKIYNISCVGFMSMNSPQFALDPIHMNPMSSKHLTKVGVILDYDGGSISYYDQNHTLITTQPQQFSDKLCPYFVVNDPGGTLTLVQDCVWPDALQ